MRLRLTAIAFAITPATLLAHEGHGVVGEGHTLEHHVTEPMHVAAIVAVVFAGVAFVLVNALQKRRRQAAAECRKSE